MYRFNPLHDQLEGILNLAIANEDVNEANNARQIAIRKLLKVNREDLPRLETILQKSARLNDSWPGALAKLQGIIDQAARENTLLTRFRDIRPPKPKKTYTPVYEPDFETSMRDMARRTVWEAHEEAGREYGYDRYRHPWVHWQRDRDQEDDDAGWEWFRDLEQPSWSDQLYEQSRTPPWQVWSRDIGPAEIFSLIQDLLDEEHLGGAVVGLANLSWPPYDSFKIYALEQVPVRQLAQAAKAVFAHYELQKHYWLLDTLLEQKLLSHDEPTPEAVEALHQYMFAEMGIRDCCAQSSQARTVVRVLNRWNWQVHPKIVSDAIQMLDNALEVAFRSCEECAPDLFEGIEDLTQHSNPMVAQTASQMVIRLVAENVIDIRDIRYWESLSPNFILNSPQWRLLEEAVAEMTNYVNQPSAWRNLWLPLSRYIKITQLTDEPLPQLMPLLEQATLAIEDAAAYRADHLYKDFASRSSLRRTWQPSDMDLQMAAAKVANYLIPEDSRSLELLYRLADVAFLQNSSTRDINRSADFLRGLSRFPYQRGSHLAEQILASHGNNRKLDWLTSAYRPTS